MYDFFLKPEQCLFQFIKISLITPLLSMVVFVKNTTVPAMSVDGIKRLPRFYTFAATDVTL